MTVGELKKALEDVPDKFPVLRAGTWREITKARADSYLRATPPNVFVVFEQGDYDPFEKESQ